MAGNIYATSWVKVCNIALSRLGTASISSLTEGSQNALFCNTLLPNAIENVLAQYDWSCSRKRISLNPDGEAPAFGYEYQFPLPVDCVRIVHADLNGEAYTIENGRLLTDSPTLNLVYIARPADPSVLSVGIRDAISKTLAFLLSTPLSSDENMAARVAAAAQNAIERAKTDDAMSGYDAQDEGLSWYDEARR